MISSYTNAARRDIFFAILLLLLGSAGLIDIRYGGWRPGPGIGNHLIPMVVYWVIVASGLALMIKRMRPSDEDEAVLTFSLFPIAGGLLWASVYFLAVRHVGIAVSTTLFMAAAFWCLSHSDARGGLGIGVVSVSSGAVFWLLFTQMAPILLPRQIIF